MPSLIFVAPLLNASFSRLFVHLSSVLPKSSSFLVISNAKRILQVMQGKVQLGCGQRWWYDGSRWVQSTKGLLPNGQAPPPASSKQKKKEKDKRVTKPTRS